MLRDLSTFQSKMSFHEKFKAGIWRLFQVFFLSHIFFPKHIRIMILRMFGAKIGSRVVIRAGIRVSFPWNLTIGENCWIGENVWFINHAKIEIGRNVCISQQAILCSGGHDFKSSNLKYRHGPIHVDDGAWICLGAKVLANSHVGKNSVLSANETLNGKIPDNHIYKAAKVLPIDYEQKPE